MAIGDEDFFLNLRTDVSVTSAHRAFILCTFLLNSVYLVALTLVIPLLFDKYQKKCIIICSRISPQDSVLCLKHYTGMILKKKTKPSQQYQNEVRINYLI
jgi:hypothetical protein